MTAISPNGLYVEPYQISLLAQRLGLDSADGGISSRSHWIQRCAVVSRRRKVLAMDTRSTSPATIDSRIHTIRGLSVLLDTNLAELYGVTTKALLQAVRRNRGRFPEDFIFQLSNQEVSVLRSQTVTAKTGDPRGGRRPNPYAFTEQGVAMLSSILRSATAVRVNIEIMRAFVRLRRAALVSGELMKLVEDLSTRVDTHDRAISELVKSIRQLIAPLPGRKARPIGFTADLDE